PHGGHRGRDRTTGYRFPPDLWSALRRAAARRELSDSPLPPQDRRTQPISSTHHRRVHMAKKTLLVVGFGPGISTAVAERFGTSGFSVALIARSEQKLTAGAEALKAKGIEALGFT